MIERSLTTTLPQQIGRYEVVGQLATGGMAEILLCRLVGPSGFERALVIKRILPHLAANPDFVSMFLDEGRIAAKIAHPNVVQVFDLARDEGDLYQVMEYLEGEAVVGLLRRLRMQRKSLDYGLTCHIVASACAGLHAAHELRDTDGTSLGLVHRDISPDNIFVGYDGTVKVLDFGIAKATSQLAKTNTGTIKGKFAYMSPEQTDGQDLDRRSDVFALGIVLYELLTQCSLYRRKSPAATIRAILDEPLRPPSDVRPGIPKALEKVCVKALSKSPSDRFQTARDMRLAILSARRNVADSAIPEEGLASLMAEVFEDRISQKEEMLAEMRDLDRPTSMVVPAIGDESIELPSAVVMRPVPSPQRGSKGVRSVAAALAIVGVAAAVGLWLNTDDQVSEPPGPLPASETPEPERIAAPVAVPTTEQVRLSVASSPTGAEVFVGGEARGETPMSLEASIGTTLELRLEAPGRRSVTRRVEVTEPDVLRFRLERRGRTTTMGSMASPSAAMEPGMESMGEPPGMEPRGFRRL